jgi:enterochelin esterase-like enzyme
MTDSIFAGTSTPITKPVCDDSKGSLITDSIPSELLKKDIAVRIYTPPCIDKSGKTAYPVLYLLHGQSYKEDQWVRLGVPETADLLIQSGLMQPLIIVMPGEANYLEDMRSSNYDDAILEEVLPWVEGHFPAQKLRTGRAIGGLSRGSGWAMHLGLSHPDLFVSIGAHSLTQISGDYYSIPKWRTKTLEEELPRIYIDIGLQDRYKDPARGFELRLSEYSYPHEWHLNLGTHNEEYWSSHVKDYLRWYNEGWPQLEN